MAKRSAGGTDALRELGRLAAELGPSLVPVGHSELLRSIISTARSIFQAEACSLALLDETGEHLMFHVVSGGAEREITGMRLPVGQGIAGWVVTSGQPIAVHDVTADPRFARDVADAAGYVPTSILAMPLETDQEIIGVIEVLDPRRDAAGGPDGLELLSVFARQAALAIENSRVFSDLGRALLRAAGALAEGEDLVGALEQAARDAPPPQAELAELAAHFAELGRMGTRERASATRLLGEFLTYLRGRPQT